MMVHKKQLSRRTVLRGMGVSLAMPFLDAMVPSFTPTAKAASQAGRRLSIVYVPNGINMENWTPIGEGAGFDLRPTMVPLKAYHDRMTVLTALSNVGPTSGDGGGPHARAGGAFLTGRLPKRTEGPDVRAGVSFDQVVAKQLGRETQFSSLEFAIEPTHLLGTCDAGSSCTYVNTLCWATETSPLPMENHPRAVFERLFGDGSTTNPAVRRARMSRDRSILDSVTQSIARMQRDLGAGDRQTFDQYVDSVREIERQIQVAEAQTQNVPVVDRPAGVPERYEDHVKLMFDLQVEAPQADLTRMITFMMAREVSQLTYPEIGVPGAHHTMSHHGGNADMLAAIVKINFFHATLFSYYLDKLAATPNGDGSLLDNMIVLYCGGISEGNSHSYDNLPLLLVGGGGGRLKTAGRHVVYPKGTPLSNLWLTLLDKLDVPLERFGDSTGTLSNI